MAVDLVIDGVTGVGKSSLVEIISKELGLEFFEEVFEDKNQLLYRFFKDREKWCFPMQVNFLTNRFRQYKEALSKDRVVMDRSIFSDRIFARMYREQGCLTPEEFDVYENLYDILVSQVALPHLTVYLRAGLDETVSRIKRRGRPEELEVEVAYWERLHLIYEEHYANLSGNLLALDVGDRDFVHDDKDRAYVVGHIRERLQGW